MMSPEFGKKINTRLTQAADHAITFVENNIPQSNPNIVRYSAFRIVRALSQKVTPKTPIAEYKGYTAPDAESPKEKYVLVKESSLNDLISQRDVADSQAIERQSKPITIKIDQPENDVDHPVVTATIALPRKKEIIEVGKTALDLADAVTYVAAEGLVDLYKRAKRSEAGINARATFRRLTSIFK